MFDLYDFPVDKSNAVVRIKYPQSVEKQSFFCDAFTQIIYGEQFVQYLQNNWFYILFD